MSRKQQKFLIKCDGKLLDIMVANDINFKTTKETTFNKETQTCGYGSYFELDQENFDKLNKILEDKNNE